MLGITSSPYLWIKEEEGEKENDIFGTKITGRFENSVKGLPSWGATTVGGKGVRVGDYIHIVGGFHHVIWNARTQTSTPS